MRHISTGLGWMAMIVFAGLSVQGQPEADNPQVNRVGMIVELETPGVLLNETDLLETVLRQVKQGLAPMIEEGRVSLVDQAELIAVQNRLGVKLGERSKPQAINTVAKLLELDRLVVFRITIADHFKVLASATVFNARGQPILNTRIGAAAPELDRALEQAVGLLVRQISPALLR